MVNPGKRLGRGLEALLSSGEDEQQIAQLNIHEVTPRKDQPRKNFQPEGLKELALSIKNRGVLQPIIVRKLDNIYELIAGERRWRAAKIALLETIPALVVDVTEKEAAEMALVENLQREDLSAWEEARAFKQLMEQFHYTQEQMAESVGKSRSYVANALRILTLPEGIQNIVANGQISAGHARTLLAFPEEEQGKLAQEIIKDKLSVRTLEKMVKARKATGKNKPSIPDEIFRLQEDLQNSFSTKVRIVPKKQGGKIEIDYYDEEDLERIAEMLGIVL